MNENVTIKIPPKYVWGTIFMLVVFLVGGEATDQILAKFAPPTIMEARRIESWKNWQSVQEERNIIEDARNDKLDRFIQDTSIFMGVQVQINESNREQLRQLRNEIHKR